MVAVGLDTGHVASRGEKRAPLPLRPGPDAIGNVCRATIITSQVPIEHGMTPSAIRHSPTPSSAASSTTPTVLKRESMRSRVRNRCGALAAAGEAMTRMKETDPMALRVAVSTS